MARKTDSKVKLCIDCGVDISEREGGAKRCVPCAVLSPKNRAKEKKQRKKFREGTEGIRRRTKKDNKS